MLKIVIQPFVGLVLEEKVDNTGGIVHGPRPYYVVRDGYCGREYVYDAADCRALDLPACCWAEFTAPPVERLYAAYWRSGHHSTLGKTESGPAPSWAELKARAAGGDPVADREILRWEETAKFALDFLPPFQPAARAGSPNHGASALLEN